MEMGGEGEVAEGAELEGVVQLMQFAVGEPWLEARGILHGELSPCAVERMVGALWTAALCHTEQIFDALVGSCSASSPRTDGQHESA